MKATQFFAAAAIAALALAGCSTNEPAENPGAPKTVTVKVVTSGIARAADKTTVPYGYKTPVNDVTLYFLDGNDRVVSSVGYLTGAEITNGKTFTGISASAVKVYVVANTTNSANGTPLFPGLTGVSLNQPKSVIETMAAAVGTQMNNSDMGIDNVVLSGENSFIPVGATDYTASVTLTPAVCRFEVTSITANQSGVDKVTAFDLSGIYLNTYYSQFTIGGGFVAGSYYGLSNTEAELAGVDDVMKDVNLGKTGALTYSTSATDAARVWAYMMAVGNTPPMIVFKLDNVEVNGMGTLPSTKYVTVKNFKDSGTGQLISPKRGEVYVIRDVAFTPNDITDNPHDEDISITVTVEVMGWKVYSVDPLL